MNPEIKKAHFTGPMFKGEHTDAVSYAIFPGQQVVFTILMNGGRKPMLSTANHAEAIIASIASQESMDLREATFFELETPIAGGLDLGQYLFHKISFKSDGRSIENIAWQQGCCNADIINRWAGYIVRNPGRDIPCNRIAPSTPPFEVKGDYCVEDLYDIMSLIFDVYGEDASPQRDRAIPQFADDVMRVVCRENHIECDEIDWLMKDAPRDTRVGSVASAACDAFLEWLTEQHPEFYKRIGTPIFEPVTN